MLNWVSKKHVLEFFCTSHCILITHTFCSSREKEFLKTWNSELALS
jgi:hypothetical protein